MWNAHLISLCGRPMSGRLHSVGALSSHGVPLSLAWQVMLADSLPAELYRTICAFNADLLSQSLGGRTLLVQRLAELLRVREQLRQQLWAGIRDSTHPGCPLLIAQHLTTANPHRQPLLSTNFAGQPAGGTAGQPPACCD